MWCKAKYFSTGVLSLTLSLSNFNIFTTNRTSIRSFLLFLFVILYNNMLVIRASIYPFFSVHKIIKVLRVNERNEKISWKKFHGHAIWLLKYSSVLVCFLFLLLMLSTHKNNSKYSQKSKDSKREWDQCFTVMNRHVFEVRPKICIQTAPYGLFTFPPKIIFYVQHTFLARINT